MGKVASLYNNTLEYVGSNGEENITNPLFIVGSLLSFQKKNVLFRVLNFF